MTSLLNAQLSPGDLAEVHAHLEGLSNCTQCHVLNQKVSNDKCLNCHDLLNDRIAQGKGYHSSAEIKGKECIECHSDHHGRKFQMIRFDTVAFDHELTGYQLEGAHKEVSCAQCHRNEFITSAEVKKLKRSYLGLTTECLSCHEDYHQETLPANCMACHSFESFKSTPNFDHANTSFPLLGKHQEVSCDDCHPTIQKAGSPFQVFKGLDYASCTDCHTDVHDNKFGQDCRRCHTEQSFHQIVAISSFDHSKTGYQLEGMHQTVACRECHPVNYTNPVKHELCLDCHHDYHNAQFVQDDRKMDCVECHSVHGFQPSTFTIDAHQQGPFPLEGAHLATPCFACHLKENRWEFRQIGISCADCHEDIHNSYLDTKYYPEQDCKSCHSLDNWKDIGFDHRLTEYPLEGGHNGVSCIDCHKGQHTGGDLKFGDISTNCVTCHQDIHAGQFEVDGFIDCSRCHDNTNWQANLFDHDRARFILDGQHDKLSCIQCHTPVSINGISTIQYKFEDIRCESCH
jgi:nitrate/TMAO reductase-like tetraheme cytochrome c subunit